MKNSLLSLPQWPMVGLCCLMSVSLSTHAAVPIERRSLTSNAPVTGTPATTPHPDGLPIAPLLEPAQPSMLWQLTEQVQQLQEEVRRLRGNNESQEQKIEVLEKELQSRFIDFDQRVEQLQDQLRSKLADTDSTDLSSTDSANTTENTTSTTPQNPQTALSNNAATNTTATSNSPAKVIPPPPINPANSASSNAGRAGTPTPVVEQKAYIAAYDAYKAGGTQKAIVAMEQFMRDYPQSVYIPNAHYWLGEFYLALTPPDLNNAQKEFNVVMGTYPRSARAAAAIYRLASIAEINKRTTEATRLMNILLNDYPASAEAGYAKEFLNKRRS